MTSYAELQVTTNFSFLRGGSHADELMHAAKAQGLAAMAVTDRNTMAGMVRAHIAAKAAELPLIVGCRLDLQNAPSLLCYPKDRAAYGRLCRLLTVGKMRAEKGACLLSFDDVAAHGEGQIFVVLPPDDLDKGPDEVFEASLNRCRDALAGPVYLAAQFLYRGDDRRRIAGLDVLANRTGTRLVATNDVHYHDPSRRALQDVITCIREKCRIDEAGFLLAANAERHIKPPGEIARLFKGFEHALERTLEIAGACRFSLDELRYEYPDEPVPAGKSPQSHLVDLTWQGAHWRYPGGIPAKVSDLLGKELELIAELEYAPYFLTVHDIVNYARSLSPPILCQGRGSAANSTVCYCLGVTAVDPVEIDVLVERFISAERNEPPDIDIDFEHERREEVIQYIYQRYGRHRAGIAATVISYRARSAVREVGKVMGLSEDVATALVGTMWGSGSDGVPEERVREAGLDPEDPHLARTLRLAEQLMGFPRHLSQHVGGFVLTRGPLSESVPIGNAAMDERTFIEWDKDDINALGILKVDVLGLGMLTCIRKCFELLHRHYGIAHTLATVPREDPAVYEMIQKADTIGVFQIESRAQMSMLPRLKPASFYDLVIEIAIVRPGPIQGNMVHPYLRRRSGEEPVIIPSPGPGHGDKDELTSVLGKTMGVPLFQEQAMRLAMVAAQFTPGELNELRHAMATFRRRGTIHTFEAKMVTRMTARGYEEDFARRCFDQIKGFGEYGFPESHSASFAHLAYVSSWLKCHHPDVFACGLLNAQPMGFYAPAQIVRDARQHGVEVRPPDINFSGWDNTLEPVGRDGFALRLGLRQIDGLGEDPANTLVAVRDSRFDDMNDLVMRSGLPPAVMERLAAADAFRSIGLDRRQALWQARGLARSRPLPLFEQAHTPDHGDEPQAGLPDMPLPEHVVADYQTLRLSLKAHPMEFMREYFARKGVVTNDRLVHLKDGKHVAVAGVVLVRQRPGTARGVIFMTLEDETGVANTVTWPDTFQTYRKIIMGSRLVLIRGRLQSHDGVIHVVAERYKDHTHMLQALSQMPVASPLAHADEVARPVNEGYLRRHPRNAQIIPKSRDFH